MENVVAVCLGFCGMAVLTFLVRSASIGGGAYVTGVGVVLFFAVIIARIDLIEQLKIGNATAILRRAEEARDQAAAKAAEVQRMGEQVAALTAFNITSAGRLAGDDSSRKMLEARDRIIQMLRDLGSSPARIKELITPINQTYLFDLKIEVDRVFQEANHLFNTSMKQQRNWESIRDAVELHLWDYDRDKLIQRSKDYSLYDPRILPLLDQIEAFARNTDISIKSDPPR